LSYNTWKCHKETPCVSTLIKQKCHFFLLQNWRTGGQNRSCLGAGGGGPSGRRKEVGKGCRRVNMEQILCIHVCKWKNDTVDTIPEMGGGKIKKN
jgi:hypothetical protein